MKFLVAFIQDRELLNHFQYRSFWISHNFFTKVVNTALMICMLKTIFLPTMLTEMLP
jgi:hypothetical protein